MSDLENRVRELEKLIIKHNKILFPPDKPYEPLFFKDSGSLRPGTISPTVNFEVKHQDPSPKTAQEAYDWCKEILIKAGVKDVDAILVKPEPTQGGKLAAALRNAIPDLFMLSDNEYCNMAESALDSVLRVIDEYAKDIETSLYKSTAEDLKKKLRKLL